MIIVLPIIYGKPRLLLYSRESTQGSQQNQLSVFIRIKGQSQI
ncbi:hypothetical protein NC653_004304 [Populus alba x Populus x berolinensis]|uniref:Uncharacterized protein n=1 Tax=Populus alba x Populus x berolinensis TaxID=444605 RepID=A0AAD6RUI2_9ROSI|nr:hypothetical protein NC653_004304 [Populus alba x Populus x berolinensis]